MVYVEKLKEKISGLKNSSFLIAFLVLVIYMLDRAIGAIIYPVESSIITNLPQNDGSMLYLLELESVTSYATNSILFPILLLIFYRLAKVNKLPLLIMPITLHYLSVIIVSTYFLIVAAQETSDYLQRVQEFESEAGERFRVNESLNSLIDGNDRILGLFETDDGRFFYVKSWDSEGYDAPEENRVYLNRVEARLSLRDFVVHYYSPLMALFLVFLSALSLRYCYRLNLDELFKSEEERKDDIKEHVADEETK